LGHQDHYALANALAAGPLDRRDERQPSFVKGGIVFLNLRRGEGQGLAEYALILSLIVIMAVLALMFVSGNLNSLLSSVGKAL
jgi:Flp pilus assembly pilin Flp